MLPCLHYFTSSLPTSSFETFWYLKEARAHDCEAANYLGTSAIVVPPRIVREHRHHSKLTHCTCSASTQVSGTITADLSNSQYTKYISTALNMASPSRPRDRPAPETAPEEELATPSSFSGPVPSSMNDDFFEESRAQKLFRKIRQEPLIPLGCLATCYALLQASKSIRAGNPTRTNKMFRARIYAQGFTLAAIVAGSFFYKDERMKRKNFEEKVEEKKGLEKKERWLRELEMRDIEEREWREKIEKKSREAGPGMRNADVKGKAETQFATKSIREDMSRIWWTERTWDAWRRS
jgi:hypothetical protein